MNFLRNLDSKIIIAGLGTMAVLGSFVVAAVAYAILSGLGVNDGVAWGMAMLAWIGAIAVGIVGIVYVFNNNFGNRVEQVTVIREIREVQAPSLPAAETAPRLFLDAQVSAAALGVGVPSASAVEGNTFEPEVESVESVESHEVEPVPSAAPSVSFRSLLAEGAKTDEPESESISDEPATPVADPAASYRSLLAEGGKKED